MKNYLHIAGAIVLVACVVLGARVGVYASSAIQKEEPDLRMVPLEAYAKYSQALDMALQARYEEAVALYRVVLALDPNSVSTHMALAKTLRELGQQDEALQLLEKAATLAEDQSEVFWELGQQYLRMGEQQKAIEHLERAVGLDPENFLLRQALANIYVRLGDIRSALRQWEAALDSRAVINSASFRVSLLEHIASIYEQLGEYSRAAEWYRQAIPFSPTPALLRRKVGEILLKEGDTAGAVTEFLRGLKDQPGYLPLRYQLADSYLRLKEWDKAYSEFQRYLADAADARRRIVALLTLMRLADHLERPDEQAAYRTQAIEELQKYVETEAQPDPRYMSQLGALLFEAGQHLEAIAAFQRALELAEPDQRVLLRQSIAEVYEKAGQLAEAEQKLMRLAADYPQNSRPVLVLADFRKRHDRRPEAIQILRQALETLPRNETIPVYVTLANYHTEVREYAAAIDVLEDACLIDPDNPILNNHLGYLYAVQGIRLESAVELVKKALMVRPNEGAFLDSLAWAYYKLARFEEARAEIEKAIAAYNNEPDPVIRDHYGDILWALGEHDAARQQWQQALAEIDMSTEELDREVLERKIEGGLDAVPRAPAKPPDAPVQ